MVLPIALQIYSVRNELAKDFYGTLKKVKEMGYDGVEMAGLEGRDPLEVKQMLAEIGLEMCSSHVPVAEMLEEGGIERYKQVGCKYVAIPWMAHGQNNEKLEENLKLIQKLAVMVKEHGMQLLYHNHDFEFKRVDGKAALDIIYDTVPAELLQTELDTCWVKFAGADPIEYLHKYAGRAPLVHLKDFFKEEDNNAVPYELIGTGNSEKQKSRFEYRPLGYGVQDMPAILEASKAAGADWVVVEQDESVGRSTLEAAKLSIDYLHSLEW